MPLVFMQSVLMHSALMHSASMQSASMQSASMQSASMRFIRAAAGATLIGVCAGAMAQTSTPTEAVPTAQVSSDQNVPPATARKQAAEIARGDPARWTREDTTTAARLASLQKETRAALQESLGNCRTAPKAERAACTKQARETYQQEMAGAKAQAMAGQ